MFRSNVIFKSMRHYSNYSNEINNSLQRKRVSYDAGDGLKHHKTSGAPMGKEREAKHETPGSKTWMQMPREGATTWDRWRG